MTGPALVLLHGLGATAGVWAPLIDQLDWPGPVVGPDLPGHGRAPWTGDYTVGALAAAVSAQLEPGRPVVVVGHSLGGAVGLALASGWFRPVVEAVIGVGIKVVWTDDDVAQMAAVAGRGVRWFDTRDEAVDRFARQSGLVGLVGPDHPALATGVTQDPDGGDRWRVAQDPATFAQTKLDMAGLMEAATATATATATGTGTGTGTGTTVVLGAGEHDAMVSADDLARYAPRPAIRAGRGHNVHVEDPAWLAELIRGLDP